MQALGGAISSFLSHSASSVSLRESLLLPAQGARVCGCLWLDQGTSNMCPKFHLKCRLFDSEFYSGACTLKHYHGHHCLPVTRTCFLCLMHLSWGHERLHQQQSGSSLGIPLIASWHPAWQQQMHDGRLSYVIAICWDDVYSLLVTMVSHVASFE